MKHQTLFSKLLDKLEDKNYNFLDIFKFLEERFIPLPPIIIHDPICTGCERDAWEYVYKPFIEEALIEIDYLKHK